MICYVIDFEFKDALQYIQKIMNPRAPPNQREIVVDVIRNVLDRRWKKYPDMCRRDPAGADLASKAERFLQLLDPKIIRKHEIIGTLLVDIHRISQQKLLHTIKANPTNPNGRIIPPDAPHFTWLLFQLRIRIKPVQFQLHHRL